MSGDEIFPDGWKAWPAPPAPPGTLVYRRASCTVCGAKVLAITGNVHRPCGHLHATGVATKHLGWTPAIWPDHPSYDAIAAYVLDFFDTLEPAAADGGVDELPTPPLVPR